MSDQTFSKEKTLESIFPKKGKLPVSIAQLASLRLKQPPPPGSKVVLIFDGNGNVTTGVTSEEVKMTNIADLQRVNAARSLAQKTLVADKKSDLEHSLSKSVLDLVGQVDLTTLNPTPQTVQELRRVNFEHERASKNAAALLKLPAQDELRKAISSYFQSTSKVLSDVFKMHMMNQLYGGSARKEQLALTALLADAGIPRAVYTKLTQPNLVDSMQVDLYGLLFGTKISKGLKLGYDELLNQKLMAPLRDFLSLRNAGLLKAIGSVKIRERILLDLDETDRKRLMKTNFLMVGPGNHSKEWRAPQPLPPIPYGSVAEILQRINQNEVNFHSGVIPMGVRAVEFWNDSVIRGKKYSATDRGQAIAVQASDDGAQVLPTGKGFTIFPRDMWDTNEDVFYAGLAKIRGLIDGKDDPKDPIIELEPKPGEEQAKNVPIAHAAKVEERKDSDVLLPVLKTRFGPGVNGAEVLETVQGKSWMKAFVQRIFLHTSEELALKPVKIKVGGQLDMPIPSDIRVEIQHLKMGYDMKLMLVQFLMQFSSPTLMRTAFDRFSAQLMMLQITKDWMGPSENDEANDAVDWLGPRPLAGHS
jgi:hypothetical protein